MIFYNDCQLKISFSVSQIILQLHALITGGYGCGFFGSAV
jgi:hypothetical protein